jgi:hypothetical protein
MLLYTRKSMTKNSLNDILTPLDNTFNASDDPLLLNNNSSVYVINGRRGSGKSSLILNLMNSKKAYRKRFTNVFLISPTAETDKKFHKLVKELKEEDFPHFYDTLNEENIEEILKFIRSDNDENDKKHLHCLILDDVVLDLPKSKSSLLNRIVITSRHLNLTIIVVTQKYNAIPTIIRNNMDLCSFFPSLNNHEIKTFQEDINIDKDIFNQIYEFCCDESNSFMHVNLLGARPKFYRKFEPIEFVEG